MLTSLERNSFDRKSAEPVQKHVNEREQRISPELNAIISVKLRHERRTTTYHFEAEGTLKEEDDQTWLRY